MVVGFQGQRILLFLIRSKYGGEAVSFRTDMSRNLTIGTKVVFSCNEADASSNAKVVRRTGIMIFSSSFTRKYLRCNINHLCLERS